jgi:hypothetical protein
MSKTMVCKFRCDSIGQFAYNRSEQVDGKWVNVPQILYTVKMSPVYSADPESENKKFWDATPQGSFEMGAITDSSFEVGKSYLITVTKAE